MLNHTTQFLYVRMITGPNNYDATQRCLGEVLIASPLCGFCDFPQSLVHWLTCGTNTVPTGSAAARRCRILCRNRSLCPLDALAEPQVVYLYLFA